MIVRNYFEAEARMKPSHQGKGLVKHVHLFDQADFETRLKFIIYCEIDPGSSIGYHHHGENEEVYVVLEGQGVMTVNDQDRTVKAGDVILNKPGWSHGLENDSDERLEILVFEVSKE